MIYLLITDITERNFIMSTTKLQNEIVNATSMLMKGIDALENITRLAIDEGKAKPNQSDWIYLGNHISVYVNYQLQKKVEELTEKAHEANAQAEANHAKAGSAIYYSENEKRHTVVRDALDDCQKSWSELCKNFGFRTDWNDLNDKPINKPSVTDVNVVRKNLGLEPLQGK